MDILCHALESWTARPYSRYERKRPEQRCPAAAPTRSRTCGRSESLSLLAGRSVAPCGRRRPRARGRWRWPPPSPASASATPGCTCPHANAYPIAGRVRDFRPDGYPAAEAMVPHGMAVAADRAGGVPLHLRRRAGAAPAAPPGSLGAGDGSGTGADVLPGVLRRLMRDVGMPDGLRRRGLRRGRRGRPGRRGPRAAAAAGDGAEGRHRGRARPGILTLAGEVVSRPETAPAAGREPTSRGCCREGVTDVPTTRAGAGAGSTTDASLYRVVPLVVVRPRHPTSWPRSSTSRARPGVPLTARGAGTSIAGNAVGAGIVVDCLAPPRPGARPRRGRGPRASSPAWCTPRCSEARAVGCASGRTRRRTPAAPSAA